MILKYLLKHVYMKQKVGVFQKEIYLDYTFLEVIF